MKYRITFDVDHNFSTEPGWVRSVPLQHFRPDERSFNDTYREPTTGVVMLNPASFNRVDNSNFVSIDSIRLANEAWQSMKRQALTRLMTNGLPAGADAGTILEIIETDAIIAILSSAPGEDNLVWSMQTNFSLYEDECFAIHYNSLSDAFNRKYNWMGVHWDNIFIHLATTGKVRVYRYADRSDKTQTPDLVQEFHIAHPGDMTSKDGMIFFLPIPGIGLVMQHADVPQQGVALVSNTQTSTSKSVLIPWTWSAKGDTGYYRMFEATPLTLALNPYLKYAMGIERIRFASSGSYIDAPFDPGYTPSGSPSVLGTIIPTGYGTMTESARKADDSGAFVAGTDRKGRAKFSLTGDSVHTPFLTNYSVSFAPVTDARSPGSIAPTKLHELEYSYDEYERFEGRATVMMSGADLKTIARRGDATFLLEKSTDGVSWSTLDGGIATDWENEYTSLPIGYGHHIKSTCALQGMHYRLDESHIISEMAFDGNSVGDAINSVLQERGFSSISWSGLPHENILLTGLTAQENTWKYAPKIGEGGWATIMKLLFNVRTQNREYYIKYNWDSAVWQSVRKTRDTTAGETWYLVNDSATKDTANRKQRYSTLTGRPFPPEANEIVVVGMIPGVKTDLSSSGQNSTARHLATARNVDSLNDANSLSYAGRIKRVMWAIEEAAITGDVSKAARRVLDAVGSVRQTFHVKIPDYQSALTPNRYLELWDETGTAFVNCWLKRVTVKCDMNDKETCELELDTVWEGDLP